MKKLFLSIVTASLFFASCGETAKKEENTGDAAPTVENTEEGSDPAPAEESSTLPKMSSPEAQKFVEEYDAYMKNYLEAVKSKDATKLQEFATSAQEWATKAGEFATKLTPEDAKAWSDYAQKWATEVQNSMQ